MDQASSQLNSSADIELGSYVMNLLDLEQALPRLVRGKTSTQRLIDGYQKTLTKKATRDGQWIKFADYLRVGITKNKKITVYIDGPDEVENEANMLEYGTPDSVANPLMRVSEEEFNADFDAKRMLRL